MALEVGDIVWVDLDPVKGSEQAGRRPALIVSGAIYHGASRRAVICPITRNTRPWPFNVPLPPGLETEGVVLVDQVRSIDRAGRLFGFVERAPPEVLASVRGQLAALLGLDAFPSITEAE
jgi:mRNA interferase MazF